MMLPRRLAVFSIAIVALLFATAAARTTLKAGTFEPAGMAPELSLQSSNGGTLSLAKYRGKVVLLGFGFTSCPKVCPTTLAVLAQAKKRLGDQGKQVQVVYVTVDPERDTPEQMRGYLALSDPTFIGGTGTPAQLAAVFKDFGVTATRYEGRAPDEYGFEHSSFVYLIDREGRIRAMAPYGKSAADIAHDAAILLQ